MKNDHDIHKLIQDLQAVTVTLPKHKTGLRKQLIAEHASRAVTKRPSQSRSLLMLRVTRRMVSVGLVVVSATILVLGLLFLLPVHNRQSNQRPIAKATAPEMSGSPAEIVATCSAVASCITGLESTPNRHRPTTTLPPPKTEALTDTNLVASVPAAQLPATSVVPTPPTAVTKPAQTTSAPNAVVQLATPLVSASVSLSLDPLTDTNDKAKKDKSKKDKAAKAAAKDKSAK